jgi:hypothetical protein
MFDYRYAHCFPLLKFSLMMISRGMFLSFFRSSFRSQALLFTLWLEAFFLALFLRFKNVLMFFSEICRKMRFRERFPFPLLTLIMVLKRRDLVWMEFKKWRNDPLMLWAYCGLPSNLLFFFPNLALICFLKRRPFPSMSLVFSSSLFLKTLNILKPLTVSTKYFLSDFFPFDPFKRLGSQDRLSFSRWKQGKCPMIILLS